MTKETEVRILEISKKYPHPGSVLMPALDLVQRANNNYLPREKIHHRAALLNTTENQVYGMATYYSMFHTESIGQSHLQVDTNIPDYLTGAYEILKHLKTPLGIHVGETAKDGLFTLSSVEDPGSCGTCPVIQINDTSYEHTTIDKVDTLIASLKQRVMPEPDISSHSRFPANVGLYGDPTIVNNVETLACIPYIINQGANAFKPIEVTGNYGPKFALRTIRFYVHESCRQCPPAAMVPICPNTC